MDEPHKRGGLTLGASDPVTGLIALHDALGCAATAVEQAFRGDRGSASLSLIEAHAAAEEAFGGGSPEVAALSVVLSAIAQAIHSKTKRPAVVPVTPRLA
jgi:hypothetical protein